MSYRLSCTKPPSSVFSGDVKVRVIAVACAILWCVAMLLRFSRTGGISHFMRNVRSVDTSGRAPFVVSSLNFWLLLLSSSVLTSLVSLFFRI